ATDVPALRRDMVLQSFPLQPQMARQPPMFQHLGHFEVPQCSLLEPQMVLLAAPWLVPGCSWLPLAAPWLLLAAPWLLLACFLAALGLLPGSPWFPGCSWLPLAPPGCSLGASLLLLACFLAAPGVAEIHTYTHTAHTTQTYMHAYIY
ncbi:MAG: hypothetical protein QF618_04080, partial [SAR324 cluster bacterium]|nr:hypothetical protein [SAR324 cluster bacterium]